MKSEVNRTCPIRIEASHRSRNSSGKAGSAGNRGDAESSIKFFSALPRLRGSSDPASRSDVSSRIRLKPDSTIGSVYVESGFSRIADPDQKSICALILANRGVSTVCGRGHGACSASVGLKLYAGLYVSAGFALNRL
jgi:hypothetical protein